MTAFQLILEEDILDSPAGEKETHPHGVLLSTAVKQLSVASCQGASLSIEQNGNKSVLRSSPAKGWPSIEFFFIFNDFVAHINLKCKMKYLSTIKTRHVRPRYLNSMPLSSQRTEGCFRGAPTLPPCLCAASVQRRRYEILTPSVQRRSPGECSAKFK